MKKLALVTALLSTSAFAEDAVPTAPTTVPTAPPTEWYIRLDQPMINSLAQCGQEMRKKDADPFLSAIDAQLKNQPAIILAIKAKP